MDFNYALKFHSYQLTQELNIDQLVIEYFRYEVFEKLQKANWSSPLDRLQLENALRSIKAAMNIEITKHGGEPIDMRFDPQVLSGLQFPLRSFREYGELLKDALQFQTEYEMRDRAKSRRIDVFWSLNVKYDRGFYKVMTAGEGSSRELPFFAKVTCMGYSADHRDEYGYRKAIAASHWEAFAKNEAGEDTHSDFVAAVNAFRAYREAKRKYAFDQLKLWCQAHGLNALKMSQVDAKVGYLLDELKGSELKFEGNIAQKRDFSTVALTKSLLACLIDNVAIENAGPKASIINVGSSSVMTDRHRTFLFGGIRKSDIRPRKSEHYVHFAEVCAPLDTGWLQEISPQLCDKTRVAGSSRVSFWDDSIKCTYKKTYFGYTYESSEEKLTGEEFEKALAHFVFSEEVQHDDHAKNKKIIAEVESLLVRARQVQKLDGVVTAWYAKKFTGLTKLPQVSTVDLLLTPDVLSELLGFDFQEFKERVEVQTPLEVSVGNTLCTAEYFLARSGQYVQNVTIPDSTFTNVQFQDIPKPAEGFTLTVTVLVGQKREQVTHKLGTEDDFLALQQLVEDARLASCWEVFVQSKGGSIRKVDLNDYFLYENYSKKDIKIDKLDPLPLEILPEQEIWDSQTNSRSYYYFSQPREKEDGVRYHIQVFKDEASYLRNKETVDQHKMELEQQERTKRAKEQREAAVKELVSEVTELLLALKLEDHLKYGLTAEQVNSSYTANSEVSFFKQLESIKERTGLSGYTVRVAEEAWQETEVKLRELKEKLLAAKERYGNRTNLGGTLTEKLLGSEAKFTSEGYTIPFLLGSISDGYNSTEKLGARQYKVDKRWYLVRQAGNSWASYTGSYSSRFSGGFTSIALLLSEVQTQLAGYPHNFTSSSQVEAATPEQLKRARFEDLIKRQDQHEGVFAGYRYRDRTQPWELVYIKMGPPQDWWELMGLDMETGELQLPKTFHDSKQFRIVGSLEDIAEKMLLLSDKSFVNRTDGGLQESRFRALQTIKKGLSNSGTDAAFTEQEVVGGRTSAQEQSLTSFAPIYRSSILESDATQRESVSLDKLKVYPFLQSRDATLETLLETVDRGKDNKQQRDTLEWRAAFFRMMLTMPEGLAYLLTTTWNSGVLDSLVPELQRVLKGWINEYQQKKDELPTVDEQVVTELQFAQEVLPYLLPIRSFITRQKNTISDYLGTDSASLHAFYEQLLRYVMRSGLDVLENPQNHEQVVVEVLEGLTEN